MAAVKELDCIVAQHDCQSLGHDNEVDPTDPNKMVASKFQDKKYGLGRRVFNPSKVGYHCTVCGKIKS